MELRLLTQIVSKLEMGEIGATIKENCDKGWKLVTMTHSPEDSYVLIFQKVGTEGELQELQETDGCSA